MTEQDDLEQRMEDLHNEISGIPDSETTEEYTARIRNLRIEISSAASKGEAKITRLQSKIHEIESESQERKPRFITGPKQKLFPMGSGMLTFAKLGMVAAALILAGVGVFKGYTYLKEAFPSKPDIIAEGEPEAVQVPQTKPTPKRESKIEIALTGIIYKDLEATIDGEEKIIAKPRWNSRITDFKLSPDKKRVVYLEYGATNPGGLDGLESYLYVVNIDGSKKRKVYSLLYRKILTPEDFIQWLDNDTIRFGKLRTYSGGGKIDKFHYLDIDQNNNRTEVRNTPGKARKSQSEAKVNTNKIVQPKTTRVKKDFTLIPTGDLKITSAIINLDRSPITARYQSEFRKDRSGETTIYTIVSSPYSNLQIIPDAIRTVKKTRGRWNRKTSLELTILDCRDNAPIPGVTVKEIEGNYRGTTTHNGRAIQETKGLGGWLEFSKKGYVPIIRQIGLGDWTIKLAKNEWLEEEKKTYKDPHLNKFQSDFFKCLDLAGQSYFMFTGVWNTKKGRIDLTPNSENKITRYSPTIPKQFYLDYTLDLLNNNQCASIQGTQDHPKTGFSQNIINIGIVDGKYIVLYVNNRNGFLFNKTYYPASIVQKR